MCKRLLGKILLAVCGQQLWIPSNSSTFGVFSVLLQASNTADIHMENTVVGDVTTVYATIREDFEETKPRALPETLYTSISFPQYYSALAPNSAGDRSAAEPR